MISWVLWSQFVKSSATHDLCKATLAFFLIKKMKKNLKKLEGEVPVLFAIESYLTGW